MKKILISSKKYKDLFILLDNEDYSWAIKYKWHIRNGYAYRSIFKNNKVLNFSLHREIMKPLKNEIIDHINHNKLDDRKCNLRKCNSSENNRNRTSHKNTSSNYKGVNINVIKNKNKNYMYWSASIFNIKKFCLGSFPFTPEGEIEAAKAYDLKAKEIYGEFANLNFK